MDIIHKVDEFDNIYAYKSFEEEFICLFKNDNLSLKRYKKWLIRRLGILDEAGSACIDGTRFEYIEPNIYSIRHPESKHNPRAIFTFCLGEQKILLLTAFLEHNSSDYDSPKRTSKNRIILVREEFEL